MQIKSDATGWLALLRRPDELMLEVGAVGELLVARIRLLAAFLICGMPLLALSSGSGMHEVVTGGVASGVALVVAWILYQSVARGVRAAWLRFLSTGFDVTAITLVLLAFLLQGYPHTAVNSRVVWELYLLAIAATTLRGDLRVCLFAGTLCVVQYGLILAAAASLGDLNAASWAPFVYGTVNWGDQLSRLLLLAVATLISMASVGQTRRLLVLSSFDRVTGVRNRAYFDYRLERELRATRLSGEPLSLAMVDIDHFKAFNDRHGHLAGDRALRLVAGMLDRLAPDQAVVSRYGGEEFAVVLRGVDAGEACAAMDRVREEIAETLLPSDDDRGPLHLTISIGVADRNGVETPGALLDRADRNLMLAKHRGRNRVVCGAREGASSGDLRVEFG